MCVNVDISYMFYTSKTAWGQIDPKEHMRTACVQDIENISSCSFFVYPVVPIKLGKVIKYEAKKNYVNHLFRDVKH